MDMLSQFKIVTNNPLVCEKLGEEYEVDYEDVTYLQVLEKLRADIHKGHKLLTHPLSGSVKPNETPYKSVMITKESGELDFDSVSMIENSIITCNKFPVKFDNYTERMLNDFQFIDYTLISSAL